MHACALALLLTAFSRETAVAFELSHTEVRRYGQAEWQSLRDQHTYQRTRILSQGILQCR